MHELYNAVYTHIVCSGYIRSWTSPSYSACSGYGNDVVHCY